ncbi:MAG: Nif3-like dinuclear metal center hexameric protein [Phycisphaerae bacterium]
MKLRETIDTLDRLAPPRLAESWDNVGLLVGDEGAEVANISLCVDVTAAVLDEAVEQGVDLIVAHHPMIFKPLAQVTSERCPLIYRALKKGVAIYAMHTNFDAAPGGTNDAMAEALGLSNVDSLLPTRQDGQCKIVVFTPADDVDAVAGAAFEAGAGRIGTYDCCSFHSPGTGTFRGGEGSDPTIGEVGRVESVQEQRLELIAPLGIAPRVCSAIRTAHSYQTPAIDVYPIGEYPEGFGHGRIGILPGATDPAGVIRTIKKKFQAEHVRVAFARGHQQQDVRTVAVAAGSGKSVLSAAARAGAQIFVTGELGHHDALDAAEAGITCVCLEHARCEQLGMRRLTDRLVDLLPDLDIRYSLADAEPFEVV